MTDTNSIPAEIESLLKRCIDADGKHLLLKSYYGYNLPYTFIGNIKDHARDLKNMKSRPDDVYVWTYPRCGTHWGREIVNMLMRGEALYIDKSIPDSPVEVTPIDTINNLSSPRTFYTHLRFEFLPDDFIKNSGKIINIIRNPKDCVVSFYNILKAYGDGKYGQEVVYDGTWDEFLKLFLKGNTPYGSYFDYQRRLEDVKEKNPDYPILTLEFEDMKRNLDSELRKIAEFLKVPFTDKLLSEISEKCSFKKLKQQKSEEITEYSKATSKDGSEIYYRKGEIGGWKNWFTVAQNEVFDAAVAKEMGNCKYKPQYV